ncbi:MAG TPA: thiamine phosphate synthase [Bryobacteraceae bacterium]|nr:thiamine phosphate synthase [Bryobacteraceae bacterium]
MAGFTLPRFYPILDTEVAARFEVEPVTAAAEILDAGAKILQFRHKGFFSREAVEDIERIAVLCRDAGALFVVNDRVDVARVAGAAVHLGQEDLTPTLARRVAGDEMAIGYSTHNEAQLRAAAGEPADYVALGPIFETVSKRNPDPVVGLERLRLWRSLTPRPLVAIGGITRANASRVLEAGADSVAVIGDLFPGVGARVREWIAVTD